jgi:hypothetical protein
MPYGPSQNARRVRRKNADLAPLLRNSVEDVDTAQAHPLPSSFPVGAELFVAPPLCWAELGCLPYLPDTQGALRLPLLRLATGLLFSQRTPMRPREPIITNADEFAMNFEGVCILFSNFLRAGELRREPMG